MADAYLQGSKGKVQSESMAKRSFLRAAENGNANAQYRLATELKGYSKKRKWYLAAANQGHAEAMLKMSELAKSQEQRQQWLDRAYQKGHPMAIYLKGNELRESDLPAARRLILEAAEKNVRAAISTLFREYSTGGVLFEREPHKAKLWHAKLENSDGYDSIRTGNVGAPTDSLIKQLKEISTRLDENDPDTLAKLSD